MVATEQQQKSLQSRGTTFTLIKEPRGGKGLPGLAAVSVTKRSSWPTCEALVGLPNGRGVLLQQASLLWLQKGFSLPKLTVLRRSAETPRERVLLDGAGAASRPGPSCIPWSPARRSGLDGALIDGYFFRKSAVVESATRASGRMSALS